MVDKPLPRENARIATNLLHRAALLLSPDADVSTRITGELTQARRAARIGGSDEAAIAKRMIVILEQGIVHENWNG